MTQHVRGIEPFSFRRIGWLAVATLVAASLSACGGSSSSTSGVTPDGSGPPSPALTFSAAPSVLAAGGSTTLSWDATNAQSCDASDGWAGSKTTTGSQVVGPISTDTTFRLSCAGAGGGVSRQVTVAVDQGNGPSVTLTADPQQVAVGQVATLNWSSSGTTSCTASGGWSGSQDLSGTASTGPVAAGPTTFTLTCAGTSGDAVAMVSVEGLDKILRWQAPTENVDGTPLNDLAGFNIYWGTQSRNYAPGSEVSIADPDATVWEATLPSGEYFFALTAFDSEGNESGYSNEVIKVIP